MSGHTMTASLEKPKEPVRKTLNALYPYIQPHRWSLLLVIALYTISVAGSVLTPRLLGDATNIVVDGAIGKMLPTGLTKAQVIAQMRATGRAHIADLLEKSHAIAGHGVDFTALRDTLLTALIVFVAAAIFQLIAGIIMRNSIQSVGRQMRTDVQAKIDTLPLSYLDGESRGDLMSRLTNDIDNVIQALQQTLAQIFTAILTIVGITIMMLSLSWQLTLAALIVIPLGGGAAGVLMKYAAPHFRSQWQITGQVSSLVEDTFTGHTVVTTYRMHDQLSEAFKESNAELYRSSHRAQFLSGLVQPAMGVVSNLSYVVVAIIGALQVTNGQISIGGVQAFLQYSRQFNQPIGALASVMSLLQSGISSAERVFQLINAKQMADDPTATLPASAKGNISFEHVRFSYSPEKPVITDLTLDIKAGQTIAIVGPTGAGKTTLVNLLMRFYELDSGRILFDGTDIATISKNSLRKRFGMVLQDAWLFEGTIAENIAYGETHSSDAREVDIESVKVAACATSVDHMIRTLPDGYNTIVSDNNNISTGQRQLITIARAFMADPDILILDEATSSVDTRTELQIQRATQKLRKDRTSFIIAHRLSTIRDADLIMVMEHGDVVEVGSHDELVARGDAYTRLYNAQFANAASVQQS